MNLTLHNWRRFTELKLELPTLSFAICDQNGSGKTSILSAIYSLHTAQSWPDQTLKNCILHEQAFFGLDNGEIYFSGRLEPTGRLKTKQDFATEQVKLPLVLVYTPLDNQLLFLSRTKKIDFVDQILSQLFPRYTPNLRKLAKLVQYKQALIKQITDQQAPLDHTLLQTLNHSIWNLSHYFWQIRTDFFGFWNQHLNQLNQWLSLTMHDFAVRYEYTGDHNLRHRQNLDLGNQPEIFDDKVASVQPKMLIPGSSLRIAELESLSADIFQVTPSIAVDKYFESIWTKELAAGRVLWGSQRDEFGIKLNGEDAGEILSRGEMRLLILWLKYLGVRYARESLDFDRPVWWLLDDAFNEFDTRREEVLIQEILQNIDWYVISTTRPQEICRNYSIGELQLK